MSGAGGAAGGGTEAAPLNLYFINKNKSNSGTGAVEMTTRGASYTEGDALGDDEGHDTYNPLDAVSKWFGSLMSRSTNPYATISGASSSSKPRKVPVKVEPKVFFANERTFLAWLHMSVTLASISIAIVAFAEANKWSQIYGLLLMPCAIAFCGYSLYMYMRRAAMIRRKDPGPYEDLLGPIVLSGMLALSIVMNFFVKLYDFAR